MYIYELFDTKPDKQVKAKWKHDKSVGMETSDMYFTASNGVKYKLEIIHPDMAPDEISPDELLDFQMSDDYYDLGRYVSFEQMGKGEYDGKMGIAGTGAAAEVFGIVVNAITQFIKKHKPTYLYFQAAEPSRIKLYARMVDRMVTAMPGYKSNHDGNGHFIIYQPIKQIKENERTLSGFVVEALKLDAPSKVIPRDELQGYATRIKTGSKTKQDKFGPIVHASNIKAIAKSDDVNENGDPVDIWDLDDLAKQITTRPKAILGTNAKMEKSKDEGEIIYDLTLPALKGLVVDEETNDFVQITTCPGAGECQLFCYARKGGYIMFPASSMSAAQALNFLVNDPIGYSKMLNNEIQTIKQKTDSKGIKLVVRWHDAGDFFSKDYLDLAYAVARANPDVKFYAYTKIADVATGAKPENFIINFSSGAKRGETKKIELFKQQGNVVKQGITVPKDMFFDLIARTGNKLIKDAKGRTQFKDNDSLEEFKRRLAKAYNVSINSIITYDEMLAIPVGDEPKWNVIIQPGAGDRAANRKDVIDSYLMFH